MTLAISRHLNERQRTSAISFTKDLEIMEGVIPKEKGFIKNIPYPAKYALTSYLDGAMEKIYNETVKIWSASEEGKDACLSLARAKKNCGPTKKAKALLENYTPFEQMVALGCVVEDKKHTWQSGIRTYCFSGEKEKIPLSICHTGIQTSLMRAIVGPRKGALKYADLQNRTNGFSERETDILASLESLEMVRQPDFLSATILKGDSYQAGLIDTQRRYKVYSNEVRTRRKTSKFGCVELPRQASTSAGKIKEASAISNLLSLCKNHPHENMLNDLPIKQKVTCTPEQYLTSLEQAVLERKTDEFDRLSTALFFARVGRFSSDDVNTYFTERLTEREHH